ncbi:MAG: hypothetical protein PW843_25935 [Azospirillaceae bacterium]|nr:hypothetical protein [Azospirillaceae bacterium]
MNDRDLGRLGKFHLEDERGKNEVRFYGETAKVGGWAIIPDALHSFDIFYKDSFIAQITPNGEREDVQTEFPDHPNALISGFSIDVNIGLIPAEEREGAVLAFRMRRAGQIVNEVSFVLVRGAPAGEFHLDNARYDQGMLQVSTTNVHLVGWTVAQETIRTVSARMSDDVVLPVQFGIPRADVLAVRRTNPNGLNTGFSLFIPEMPEGVTDLKFLVELQTGHVLERRYTVQATRSNDEVRLVRTRSYAERRFWELAAAWRGDHGPRATTASPAGGPAAAVWAVVIGMGTEPSDTPEQAGAVATRLQTTLDALEHCSNSGWRVHPLTSAVLPDLSSETGAGDRRTGDTFRDGRHLQALLAGVAAQHAAPLYVTFLGSPGTPSTPSRRPFWPRTPTRPSICFTGMSAPPSLIARACCAKPPARPSSPPCT